MKMYTYDEVMSAALLYFNDDNLAAKTWINKYAKRDKDGNLLDLTPDDMHKRMAKAFAEIEEKYRHKLNPDDNLKLSEYGYSREELTGEKIYNLFKNFKYVIPAGSVMSGIGNYAPVSLSNCWVINGPQDSLDDIFRVCNELSQLMKRRGGVGFDISFLRPNGAIVNNSAKSSTGAASFMQLFSHVTNTIALNGRRGALMLSIFIKHPDALLFIEMKQDLSQVTGANVSVLIDDEFMECVKADKDYFQIWPINAVVNDELTHRANNLNSYDEYEYDKMYPMVYTDKSKMSSVIKQGYIKKIKAKELWDKLIHCAWNTAEPGIIFQTKHHNYSPDGVYPSFRGTCTNPCVTGDTMVAVADGRGYVSIKELAETGDDVPVYCLDDKSKLTISNMVHPRISGYDQDIYEVELENGHKIKCTGNHKFLTNDKGYVETTSLVPGDSLMIMTKSQMNWDERYHKKSGKHLPYNFMFISGSNQATPEHLMIYKHFYPNDKTFEVVHHIDYNGLNNEPSNLKGMTAKDHVAFHKQNMYGKNNPMYKISNDPERKALYGKVMSEAVSGEKNGRCKIKLDKYYKDAVKFAKKLNRNFYLKEWLDQCKDLNYPIIWDNFLQRSFGTSTEFIKKVAEDAGVEYIVSKGKLMEKYLRAKLNGYNVFVSKDEKDILIEKVCEVCGKPFITKWDTREYAYCSKECVYKAVGNKHKSMYIDKNKELIEFYKTTNINDFAQLRKEFKLKTNKVYDVRAKLAFKNIDEVKEAATMYNHKVVSIKYIGKDTVYNGTVEKYHNYFTGKFEEENQFGRLNILSINQLNCGEIFMNEDSCRLIHINLTSFVKDGKLDEDSLYKTTYETMRLADDLVDLEEQAIDRILDKISNDGDYGNSEYDLYERLLAHSLEGRRCGLGFTGLADTIALLGYKYDSDEALDMINHIMRLMFIAEMDSEIDMAITRGKFPAYNQSYEKKGNLWYETLKKDMPLLYDKMMKYGRRNISQNTVAPTGTVSLMAQCSSGIEPVFMPLYTRRVKCMKPSDRVDFIDNVGEKFTEYITVHPGLLKWAKENNLVEENMDIKKWQRIYESSPWFESTANDIDWEKRVKLQGIVQHYITHSISSTVNLPNNVTEDEVSTIYMKAWEDGLKGITVYRDGCRAGVMVSTDNKKENDKAAAKPLAAKKRPKSLPCKVIRFTNKGEKWIGVVGLLDGHPYEIFTGLQENLSIPNWVTDGEIVRNKEDGHSRYDICYLDKEGYKVCIQGLSRISNPEYWNYGKLISGLLRHGMEIKYIIKVISSLKLDDSINAWKNGIIRTFQKFEDSQEVPGEKCPECGGTLIREGGCIHCKDCGWSRCE